MDMATYQREMAVNRRAYEAGLGEKIKRDHAGHYVAVAYGRVIAAAPTYDEVIAAVERMQPVPEVYLAYPADEEPIFEPYDAFYTERW